MHTRLATLDDAAAIAEIYNHAVATSTATFDMIPRSVGEQRTWLADHAGAHPCIVAQEGDDETGTIVGWACVSPYRPRPAYSTTVEDSIYVHHEHHGRGVGDQLLGRLVALSDDHGFHTMIARIADGGEASMALHTKHGFREVGVEREVGRKFGRWIDVVVMQRLAHGAR